MTSLLWIECIAEELTGSLGIYPEITWPVSILRPDVVQDEMIPRPKIAWSPCRKVTFGKSLTIFFNKKKDYLIKVISQFESIQLLKVPLCSTVHT